jgi:hypothetical protein
MYGAREVLELLGPAAHFEQQINAIESAVAGNTGLAPDLSRTLIETVCKTILTDSGEACEGLGFNDLLKLTYAATQLLPAGKAGADSTDAALRQLASNLDGAILGISELRHSEGAASHGKDARFVPLEELQAEFAARAADALAAFLYKCHRRYSEAPPVRLMEYNDNPAFNEHIDSSNEVVRIFGFEFQPSEVLFLVDRQAYLDELSVFAADADSDEPQEVA